MTSKYQIMDPVFSLYRSWYEGRFGVQSDKQWDWMDQDDHKRTTWEAFKDGFFRGIDWTHEQKKENEDDD